MTGQTLGGWPRARWRDRQVRKKAIAREIPRQGKAAEAAARAPRVSASAGSRVNAGAGGGNSPQKVGLGVELEVHPLEVHVELGGARVRHADGDREEVAVLAQLERGGQHRRAPGATTGQLRTRQVPQRQTHAVRFSASGQRRKWVRVGAGSPVPRRSPWRWDAFFGEAEFSN